MPPRNPTLLPVYKTLFIFWGGGCYSLAGKHSSGRWVWQGCVYQLKTHRGADRANVMALRRERRPQGTRTHPVVFSTRRGTRGICRGGLLLPRYSWEQDWRLAKYLSGWEAYTDVCLQETCLSSQEHFNMRRYESFRCLTPNITVRCV